MNVLSLFDGISCGQQALKELKIPVENYYASEIDKYAISVTKKNFPDTVQLGDVSNWIEWKDKLDWSKIDLIQGGSPCQGFSFAGKQLNFADKRSALFFVFECIVKHAQEHNPNVKFLLENVRMKQEYQDVISERLGVQPVMINSALLSAQNRVRLYWTDIVEIKQPKDKGILLKDILEDNVDSIGGAIRGRYEKDGKITQRLEVNNKPKANSITTVQKDSLVIRAKEATKKGYVDAKVGEGLDLTFPNSKTRRGRLMKHKSNCLTAGNHEMGVVTNCIQIGKADLKGHDYVKRVYSAEGKAPTLNANSGGNLEPKVGVLQRLGNVHPSGKGMNGEVYGVNGKTPTITTNKGEGNKVGKDLIHWRKLTPLECERLQTLPDRYTAFGITRKLVPEFGTEENIAVNISNSQRYKALGNGWTVAVIKHIYKNLK